MRAAFYECDITPPLGGYMWGHYHDVRAYDVHDKLYAKAVVVEDKGEYAAIVVGDTCALPEEMHEIVTKRIYEYTGIAPERVCVASNHSHSGASVGTDPATESYADATYKDVFFRLTADAVTLAYKRLTDVTLKYAETEVYGISFNRNFIMEDGTYVTHGRGKEGVVRALDEMDPDLPILMFEKDGKPVGAIINFACHQCCLQNMYNGYSGDYASILSKRLKEQYGNDFVSLFLLGACGDINHVNPDANVDIPPLWYHHMGNVLADAVLKAAETAAPVEGGVKMISRSLEIPRRLADKEEVRKTVLKWLGGSNPNSFMRTRNLLHYEASNTKTSSELIVQGICIGDVCLTTLPGEVYNAFARNIKKESPFARNMVVENCNKYCGYVPTKEAFAECSDLYESSLCFHSCLIPEAGEILQKEAVDILKVLAE